MQISLMNINRTFHQYVIKNYFGWFIEAIAKKLLQNRKQCDIILPARKKRVNSCRNDGIGRRAGLKIQW